MSEVRNPHGQRDFFVPGRNRNDESTVREYKTPNRSTGWYLAMMTGTALTLTSGVALAQDGVADTRLANAEIAQPQDDNAQDGTIRLEPIAVDAKADVITGGVQLESEDFERINPQTLKDVFRQEPGVTVGSPLTVSQKIYVNGIEDTNLAVDIDGARQANKTYHHQGTTIIDPGLFKAVKVESGVAPADAGPAALGGSISLETKDGRDLVKQGRLFGGFGKLSFNDNGNTFSEELALATSHQGFDVLAYGTKAQGQDYTDGGGNTVQGSRTDNTNFIGKFAYTAPNGYRFKIAATRFDDIALRDGRTNFSLPSAFGTAWHDYSRQSTTFSFGDETPSKMWDPKLSISRTMTHLDTEQHANNRNIIARVESINGKVSNTFTTDLGAITAGGDFFRDEGSGGVTSTSHTDRTETLTNYGFFTQARTSWTDDLRTSVGGRIDHNRLQGNDGTKLNNTGLSGNVNGEYDVTGNVMAYGGFGTVFGGIPMTEVGIQQTNYDYTGVDTSRSYNGKIGANVIAGDFTFDGHVFRTRIKNAHDLDTSTRSTSYDLTTEGFNISARYDYAQGFARATFSRATLRMDSDIPTSGASEYYHGALMGDMMTLEVSHRIPEMGVRIGTTNEWVLENDDTEESRGFALNGYFVSNIYAEWEPEQLPGLKLRADVLNLLDRDYAGRANTGSYSTNSNVSATRDPGRSFLVSAKYEF